MTKTRRSLSHLVPAVEDLAAITNQAVYTTVPLGSVQVEAGFNPRGRYTADVFTPESLEGLAASIREHGILQPLWVRIVPGGYSLIAGERRYHAAPLAGLAQLPVLNFGQVTPERAEELALIENAQRSNPSIIDQTMSGFKLMARRTGLGQDELVRYLNGVRTGKQDDTHGLGAWLQATYGTGVSVWSQQRSKILNFTPDELAAVERRALDVKAAYELQRLVDPEARAQLLTEAVQGQWSAAQVREAVLTCQAPPPPVRLSVKGLRGDLGKLENLSGVQADKAIKLIEQLRALLA
ncbi:ParB/RepB/Spo0J family partition protein [Deinococcus sp. HMF7620]|uniref:ParB/RepB/Spo0J family partition protein n=1 Tax=Deinococcus arboris TaxID=2682977 RepID=A0A7C9M8C5_9DEIO|nr:ParB/RepB/Spo0J family partition protein [Deinococcus arboris]MVN88485.1 ParB/RepB/Spo0J family partition protein [Deinococcus arboris]